MKIVECAVAMHRSVYNTLRGKAIFQNEMKITRILLLLCLFTSYSDAQLSADKKQELLNAHNFYRRVPTPLASNMAIMVWSLKVACK